MNTIEDLARVMKKFYTDLDAKFRVKRDTSEVSENSARLENRTPAQVTTDIAAAGTAHIAARGASVHGDTPEQVGVYTKPEVVTLVDGRPAIGVIPVSRFGTLNFLPVGVSGGFEGAIFPPDNLHTCMNVEDDGTVVFLKPGTDGSVRDVYYGYIPNAFIAGVPMSIRNTSRAYRPPFYPAGYTTVRLLRSTRDVIMLHTRDPNGVSHILLAWTKGSYNDVNHSGVLIPIANFPSWFSPSGAIDVVLANGRLWFSRLTASESFGIQVCSVDAMEVSQGIIPAVREDKGWTTTNFYGETVTADIIQLTPTGVSSDLSAKPLVFTDQSSGQTVTSSILRANNDRAQFHSIFDPASGRVLYGLEPQISVNWTRDGQPGGATWNPYLASVWVDFVNKRAGYLQKMGNIDPVTSAITPPMTLAVNPSNLEIRVLGALANNLAGGLNDRGTDYTYINRLTTEGVSQIFRIRSAVNWYGTYQHSINWQSYAPGVTLEQAMNTGINSPVAATVGVNLSLQFGGSFGRRFGAPAFFGPNRVYVNSDANRPDGSYGTGLYAIGDVGLETTHEYDSINSGKMMGSVPRAWRSTVDVVAPGKGNLLTGLAHEFNIADLTNYKLDQVTLNAQSRKTLYRGLKQDFTHTSTITIGDALLATLRTELLALMRVEQPDIPDTLDNFRFDIYIPTSAPAYIAAWGLLTSGRSYIGVMMAEPNVRVGEITSFTKNMDTWRIVTGSAGHVRLGDAVQAFRYPAGYVGITPNYVVSRICSSIHLHNNGSSTIAYVEILYNKNTNRIDRITPAGSGWQDSSSILGFIPTKGICLIQCNNDVGDIYSKLVYWPRQQTEAEIVSSANVNKEGPFVLLSMAKPDQWNLTFSEPTDLILSGRHYMLQPTSIFLSDIVANPANMTFFVYVRVVAGQAVYEVRIDEINETSTVMYIGSVHTSANAINVLDINKVTRLGNYRVSSTPVGSGISVSVGNPDEASPLSWT